MLMSKHQQHDGGPEADRDSNLRFGGHRLHPSQQLAPLHAQRMVGRAHRRLDYLLHLHRLRFGLDRGRGVPAAAARPAHRHHRHADRVYGALCGGGRVPYRTCALAVDGGRRRPGGQRAQEALHPARRPCAPLGAAGGAVRRHHGHAVEPS